MEFLELAHLRLGAPARVAIARFCQVGQDDRSNAARLVEPCRTFRSDRLDLGEAGFLRQSDRFLVQLLRLEFATFDARKLRRDELLPGGEVCGAAVGPDCQLAVVFAEVAEAPLAFLGA
jgi:hypothetical protein